MPGMSSKRNVPIAWALCIAVVGCRFLEGNGYPSPPVILGEAQHPCVAVTPDERDAVRLRAEQQAWARPIRDGILAQAKQLVAEPLDIPHRGGQYTHWYTCERDGAWLRPESPTRHVCPICGTVYTGYPYDDVYATLRHDHWLHACQVLGMAFALDPDPAYAGRVRAILLEYASFYRDLPLHTKHNRWGSGMARLYSQTLDAAVKLCEVAFGYDLVYDAACFSAADHKTIQEDLLRPMVRVIRLNPRAVNNWQSWHNAAVGCVGFLLRDEDLVDWAINGTFGFAFQMNHSVLPSGMWYEGAPSYHWYALRAHLWLMEAAARSGIDLYAPPIVKKLFDAPLRQLLPDGTFVPLNDSDRSSISGNRQFYGVAYRRFADPDYLALLQPRGTEWALFWGVDALPDDAGAPLNLESSNDESEGLAILRDPDGTVAGFLDYGKGYAGHVHPARLNVVLYAHDDIRLVDPGRLAYGNPMHKAWFRQTVAHNTVVVDERSQRPSTGELVHFIAYPRFALVRATAERTYWGVTLDRTLLLADNVVIDVFQCASLLPRVFDLPLHFRGTLEGLPPGEPLDQLSDSPGYCEVHDPERLTEPLTAFSVDVGDGKKIAVDVLDESEGFVGLGYGTASMTEFLPVVLRRQHGADALFITVYQILEPGETPESVQLDTAVDLGIRVGDNLELHVADTTSVLLDGVLY